MKINDPLCYKIIGAGMKVHSELGNGFLEKVYHEALEVEFSKRGIPFTSEVKIPVTYRNKPLKTYFVADFICYESILVEIKAIHELGDIQMAQIYNYLKATGHHPGVLLNFGAPSLEYRRVENKFKNSFNFLNSSSKRRKV